MESPSRPRAAAAPVEALAGTLVCAQFREPGRRNGHCGEPEDLPSGRY